MSISSNLVLVVVVTNTITMSNPARVDTKTSHGNVIGTPVMNASKNQSRLKGSQDGSNAGSRRNSGGNMMVRQGGDDDEIRPTGEHM